VENANLPLQAEHIPSTKLGVVARRAAKGQTFEEANQTVQAESSTVESATEEETE
jgi:hypothetical protein